MRTPPLTRRQAHILAHLEACVAKDGVPPTFRDFGAAFGFGRTGARDHLIVLEKKGRIVREPNRFRAITIIKPLTNQERIDNDLSQRKAERVGKRPRPPTRRLVLPERCSCCGAMTFVAVCPMCRAEVAA